MTGNSETIRLTVAQAIVRYLMNQFIEIDGVETRICGGGFRHFRPRQRALSRRGALPRARRDAALSRAERAEHGLRRGGLRQVSSPPPLHVLHGERRAGHGELADRLGAGACQPPADADALRRHVPDTPARPGAATAGAFREPGARPQRCVQGRDALLGPDHASRAGDPDAACGARHDARPRRLRPGLPRPAAGRSGLGLRLPRVVLRAPRPPHPSTGPRSGRDHGRGGAAEVRRTARSSSRAAECSIQARWRK
jgi:hypothetical protein